MAKSSEKKRKQEGTVASPLLVDTVPSPPPPSSKKKKKFKTRGTGQGASEDLEGREVDTFVDGRNDGDVILAYPFGDPAVVEAAAKGLPRCGRLVPEDASTLNTEEESYSDSDDNDSSFDEEVSCDEEDIHSVQFYQVVQAGDIKRLCAATWLNDALINFWMKW